MKRIIAQDDVECGPGCGDAEALARAIHERTLGISSDALIQFAVVFFAVNHDVQHKGVPNRQLVEKNSPLASKYSLRSVAEQNSIQVAWDLLWKIGSKICGPACTQMVKRSVSPFGSVL
jgi:hypothetical protein